MQIRTKSFLVALLVFAAIAANAQIKFAGETYVFGWQAKTNGAAIREYYCRGETTNSWKTMLTLQAHPNAKEVKEVTGPYYKARESLISMPLKLYYKKKGDLSDVTLELFLGSPNRSEWLEFALARFVKTDSGVYAVIYSYRVPLPANSKKVNIDPIVRNKEQWLRQLFDIPIESVKTEFRPKD